MNAIKAVSAAFAFNEMRQRGEKIRKWAAQNDNLLLKQCANAVLEASEGKT